MKLKQISLKHLWPITLGSLLLACGGVDVAPERPYPASQISGHAVDAAISAGSINVYAFNEDGSKGQRLGTGVSDENGFYAIAINAKSQTVLIEVSGGSYIEDATGTRVTLKDGERLSAIAQYESGQALNIMLTPLTHVAAGLSRYLMAQGSPIDAALQQTRADLNTLFGFDVFSTIPVDITDSTNASNEISDSHLYGFYLAAVSSWSQWAATQNKLEPHTTYTSIGLSQVLHADIQADGDLDGKGLNSDNEVIPLAIGSVPLNQDNYRKLFAEHLLAMAHSDRNATSITLDDLRPTAEALANNTATTLFGESVATAIGQEPPSIDSLDAEGRYYNATFNYGVNITSAFGAEEIIFDIDGAIIGSAIDPKKPSIAINTQNYVDGEYQIGVRATDILGNESYAQFSVNFDNTLPIANPTSANITNQSNYTLSGTYDDNNGAGIESISVQGIAAVINTDDDTWSADIELSEGSNALSIVITDNAGNQKSMDFDVDLDLAPPTIDTADTHSTAKFTNPDAAEGFSLAPLGDQNTTPLYLSSDKLDLVPTPITTRDLDAAGIPYFGFNVDDDISNNVGTTRENLAVRLQYEKAGVILNPWRDIDPVAIGQYIVPLTSEWLADGWDQTTADEEHLIHIEVLDEAGNLTQTRFSFFADIYVTLPAISDASDVGQDTFLSTGFGERATLNNRRFSSLEYSFSNTTNKSFYLSLDDSNHHTVSNTVEQMVRKNQVRLKTTTKWRVGLIENAIQTFTGQNCPSNNLQWQETDFIWNLNPTLNWEKKIIPQPTSGEIEEKFEDNPIPLELSSDWSDVADFDNQYMARSTSDTEFSLSYQYDYVLDPEDAASRSKPALVTQWVLEETDSGERQECGEARFFQQQLSYSYEPESGFPKNVKLDDLVEETSFLTQGFEVTNKDTDTTITPISGWYLIPAGSNITISKMITPPIINNYTEISIASPETFTSYIPLKYDRTIAWTINREIEMTFAHDAGEGKLNAISTQKISTGTGVTTYQVSR